MNLQLLDILLMLIILSLNINQQSQCTGVLHWTHPIPHYLNDPYCIAAAAPQQSKMFVHLLATNVMLLLLKIGPISAYCFTQAQNQKNMLQFQGERPKPVTDHLFHQTLLKQNLVFSVAAVFSVISMGYMNLLESVTDGVSRGLLLYFLWTSVLLWAQ